MEFIVIHSNFSTILWVPESIGNLGEEIPESYNLLSNKTSVHW
jgi:hypothetical protein